MSATRGSEDGHQILHNLAQKFLEENEDGGVNEFQHFVIDRGGALSPNRQHWRHAARIVLDKAKRIPLENEPPAKREKSMKSNVKPSDEIQLQVPEFVEFFEPNPDCKRRLADRISSAIFSAGQDGKDEIILLHGLPAYGKTTLIDSILSEMKLPCIHLPTYEYTLLDNSKKAYLNRVFKAAQQSAPAVVVFDEFEEEEKHRKLSTLISFLKKPVRDLSQCSPPVVFIAESTKRRFDFDERTSNLLSSTCEIGFYTKESRLEKIKHFLSNQNCCLDKDFECEDIAVETHGYSYCDLKKVLSEMYFQAHRRCQSVKENDNNKEEEKKIILKHEDMHIALDLIVPNTRGSAHFAKVPGVTMDMIGGLHEAKRTIENKFLRKVRNFHKVNVSHSRGSKPQGIVLYGPPGCGKTLLAKAISNAAGLNFMYVNSPEVMNKYVGESERAVRRIFADARLNAPCVIFFDEFESIAGHRDEETNRVYVGVVNTFLNEVDGLLSHEANAQIYCMAATNRLEVLDPAVIRTGRFGTHVYIAPPSTSDERLLVLLGNAYNQKLLQPGQQSEFSVKLEDAFRTLSQDSRTEGMVASDLSAVLDEAIEMEESITAETLLNALEVVLKNRSQKKKR